MAWPINSALISDILQSDFYNQVERASYQRFYNRLSVEKTTTEITTTFPSFGSVPEIRQMSGISGGGSRQPVILKDWQVAATVFEWEQTVDMQRIIAEASPDAVRAKTSQIAQKAMKGMDRTLCQALISTTALGYDGSALLSTSGHTESGTAQSNLITGANITTNYIPTGAEADVMLSSAIGPLLAFQDDQGTPVNEGVTKFIVLCPPPMFLPFLRITDPNMQNYAVDSSGGTGVFRGRVEVIESAYATTTGLATGTQDRIFVFAVADEYALARVTLSDWQFNTNVGDEGSDDWNNGKGYLRSWAAFAYIPWQWQSVCCLFVT